MTIHTASKHIHKLLLAIGLLTMLVSCGGGDSSPPPPDTTPNAFTVAAITGAAVNTEVSSAPVSVTGVDQAVSISIIGGTYSIAGGAFTNVAGTVSNNQSVVVKVTSSASTNTAVEAVLTVGGVAGSFKVTTLVDVTPNDFSFVPATGVVPKSVSTSAAITVAGIDVAVPISIIGGEYSINDGVFTSTAGTVSKAQNVKVRGTASASTTTITNVVLTISDKNATYAITTLVDTVAPTAQILFPPPVSMTEGNTILVRGSASDDYNTIASVKVNGVDVTPKAAGDFSTWQISVPLTATTDTNLVVATEDSIGNKSTSAAQVMIRQADHKNAFPNANVTMPSTRSIVIDRLNGRNRLLVGGDTGKKIISIDLATAERSVFVSNVEPTALTIEPNSQRLYVASVASPKKLIYFNLTDAVKTEVALTSPFSYIPALVVDDSGPVAKIVGLDNSKGVIFANEVSSTSISIISDGVNGIPNTDNLLIEPYGIAFDQKNSRYLVTSGGQHKDLNKHIVYAVDPKTGARTVLSSNTVGGGDLFGQFVDTADNVTALFGIIIDEPNAQAIVAEVLGGKFFKVNLATGFRTLFSDSSDPASINHMLLAETMVLFGSNQYLLVAESYYNGIYAVDVVTGQRVIFSKSASDI